MIRDVTQDITIRSNVTQDITILLNVTQHILLNVTQKNTKIIVASFGVLIHSVFAMEIQTIKNILALNKGSNRRAVFQRTLKTRKGVENVVTKVTSIVVRAGIDYDNQKAVMEGRESGDLPAENNGLPWGEWVEFPFHIQHKGEDYVRFYAGSGLDFAPKVEFFLDGVSVPKETIVPLCLASETATKEEKPLAMTVKAANVMILA